MFIDFRERGRERGNIDVRETSIVASCMCLTGDPTHNLGMCPDQGLNPQPFGVWDNAPTKSPGQGYFIFVTTKRKPVPIKYLLPLLPSLQTTSLHSLSYGFTCSGYLV